MGLIARVTSNSKASNLPNAIYPASAYYECSLHKYNIAFLAAALLQNNFRAITAWQQAITGIDVIRY